MRKRRHRRRRLVVAGVVVVVVLGAAGGVVAFRSRDGGTSHTTGTPLTTAPVVRTDLVDRTDADGTLEYAGDYRVAASGKGRLTWLPDEGAVVERGERVYGIDGHTVPLFYGKTPLWRPLRSGVSDGKDVHELEHNLAKLGYGSSMTVDDDFTAATASAVRAWQDDLGVSETGAVAPGDVVMEPGAIRVDAVKAAPGAPTHGTVLTATSTTRRVTVKLPVNEQELADKGDKVRVSLPGGEETTGHVSWIGTVASAGNGSDQTGEKTENAKIPVHITLDHPSDAGRLDGAPVTVGFAGDKHKDVLAVPVNALLATPDQGYAVEVVDAGGRRHQVPVELGIFADGKVEVSGQGLAAGMKVEVPKS